MSSALTCATSAVFCRIAGAPATRFIVSGSRSCNSSSTPTVGRGDPLKAILIDAPFPEHPCRHAGQLIIWGVVPPAPLAVLALHTALQVPGWVLALAIGLVDSTPRSRRPAGSRPRIPAGLGRQGHGAVPAVAQRLRRERGASGRASHRAPAASRFEPLGPRPATWRIGGRAVGVRGRATRRPSRRTWRWRVVGAEGLVLSVPSRRRGNASRLAEPLRARPGRLRTAGRRRCRAASLLPVLRGVHHGLSGSQAPAPRGPWNPRRERRPARSRCHSTVRRSPLFDLDDRPEAQKIAGQRYVRLRVPDVAGASLRVPAPRRRPPVARCSAAYSAFTDSRPPHATLTARPRGIRRGAGEQDAAGRRR